MTTKQDIASGAKRVEELDHMQAGLETPSDLSAGERPVQDSLTAGKSNTLLGEVTLAMFQQGSSVHVRVGSPTNSSELYEGTFDSADEANTAMVEANILRSDQIADTTKVVGTGIHISGLSSQQLENAGLQRKVNATM